MRPKITHPWITDNVPTGENVKRVVPHREFAGPIRSFRPGSPHAALARTFPDVHSPDAKQGGNIPSSCRPVHDHIFSDPCAQGQSFVQVEWKCNDCILLDREPSLAPCGLGGIHWCLRAEYVIHCLFWRVLHVVFLLITLQNNSWCILECFS